MVNVCSGFFSAKPHRNVTAINASIGKPKRILHNSFGEIWQRRSHRLVALLHTRGYWYNRGEGWWIKNMPEWKTMTCKKLESWLDWQLIRKLKTKLVESSWSPLAKDFYYLAPEAQFSGETGLKVESMSMNWLTTWFLAAATARAAPSHPHILLIVSDDLGWSDNNSEKHTHKNSSRHVSIVVTR